MADTEWISIKDKLPVADKEVEVSYADGTTSLGYFNYPAGHMFCYDLVGRRLNCGSVAYWRPKQRGPVPSD